MLDFHYKTIPVNRLEDLRQDLQKIRATEELNPFQEWIFDQFYVLAVPPLEFEPRSIVIAALPYRLVDIFYQFRGKAVRDLWCVRDLELRAEFQARFRRNLHLENNLPRKRLAVCSGLAEYGRNNLAYIDGLGSFFELLTYFSDAPPPSVDTWRPVCHLSRCDTCLACENACPTHALRPGRFLLDNERCLTRPVESAAPFPQWVPKAALHSVYGCYRCQQACRQNRDRLLAARERLEFTEEETGLLLEGTPREALPEALGAKIDYLNPTNYPAIAKTLRALFV